MYNNMTYTVEHNNMTYTVEHNIPKIPVPTHTQIIISLRGGILCSPHCSKAPRPRNHLLHNLCKGVLGKNNGTVCKLKNTSYCLYNHNNFVMTLLCFLWHLGGPHHHHYLHSLLLLLKHSK